MKTDYKATLQKLSQVIDDSLVLLKLSDINQQKDLSLNIPVTSLLDQCLELCEQYHTYIEEPIRIIHHFGLPLNSPILSSLATLANTQVIKGLYPPNSRFKNTLKSQTLIATNIDSVNIEHNASIDDGYWVKLLLNELRDIQICSNNIGQRLIVFNNHCRPENNDQQNISDFSIQLTDQFDTCELIVVIEPLTGYKIYSSHVQSEKTLLSFDDYCQRTLTFIQTHPDLPIIRHEDFVNSAEKQMQEICTIFDLPFNKDFELLQQVFNCENV